MTAQEVPAEEAGTGWAWIICRSDGEPIPHLVYFQDQRHAQASAWRRWFDKSAGYDVKEVPYQWGCESHGPSVNLARAARTLHANTHDSPANSSDWEDMEWAERSVWCDRAEMVIKAGMES